MNEKTTSVSNQTPNQTPNQTNNQTNQMYYVYLPIISTRFLIHLQLSVSYNNQIKTFDCIAYIISSMLRRYNVKCTLYIDYFDSRLSYFIINGSGISVESDIIEIIDALSLKNFKPYVTKDIIKKFIDLNEKTNPKDHNPTDEKTNDEKITDLIVNNDISQTQLSRNEVYHTYKKYFNEKINLIYCGPNELFLELSSAK